MKKLLLVLACVVLASVLFVGCIPGITPELEPEPEEIEPLVVVNAILEGQDVDWSIENISEDHIYNYALTFTVLYTEVEKNQWTEVVTGTNLYPGDIDYDTLTLPIVEDMEPDTLLTALATF